MTPTAIPDTRRTLTVGARSYRYFSLPALQAGGLDGVDDLPFSLKVLLENLVRHLDGRTVTPACLRAVLGGEAREIAFRPGRVLMQDLLAGPHRPHDRVPLGVVAEGFRRDLAGVFGVTAVDPRAKQLDRDLRVAFCGMARATARLEMVVHAQYPECRRFIEA